MRGSPIFRLMARIDTETIPGCWTWTGAKSKKGYGSMRLNQQRHQSVHRFSYEYHKGAIPEGLQIDHLCRNRACVNPEHLEAVTPQVNTLRGTSVSAQNAAKTHCPQGHPFEGENLSLTKSGRVCIACRRARRMRYYYAKRAAA